MSHLALAEFIDELSRSRQLVRIAAEVEPAAELAAIARRVSNQQGPALLFGKLRDCEFPLAANLLNAEERICQALGVKTVAEVQSRFAELVRGNLQTGWLGSLGLSGPAQARWAPRPVRNGPCQQVVRLASDVDLRQFLPTASLPAALVFAQAADEAFRSIEVCSISVVDPQRLSLRWAAHRPLERLSQDAVRRGEKLPVAVSLGQLPVYTLSAAAPLEANVDRWALAGFLRDRPCDLLRCRTLPIDVPADAEVIVEGFLDDTAVMHATAITHRANLILTTTQPNELTAIRQTMLEAVRPLLLARLPEVVDYHLPPSAACRDVALVSLRKLRPNQPRQVAGALWAMEPWLDARVLILLDEDTNVRDPQDVLSRVIAHADFARDLFSQPGAASANLLGIDATRKPSSPQECVIPGSIEDVVRIRWDEYGLGDY